VDEKAADARQVAPGVCTDIWSDAGLKKWSCATIPCQAVTMHCAGFTPPFGA
jgi:hypothetical protein